MRRKDSGLLHCAQATGTNRYGLGIATDRDFDLANIGFPASVGLAVRVRHILAEHNALSAYAALCHP